MIQDITDPIQKFVAFIEERENIRIRRESGKPKPWTQDTILQTYRFTNIHREDDTVSRHYQKTIRDRYDSNPIVFPGTVLYRWFNRISTCDAIFNEPNLGNQSSFEHFISTYDSNILLDRLEQLNPPHVTGSFIINGKPGYSKGIGVLRYFFEWCEKPWREQWMYWLENPPLLEEIYDWVRSGGLGSFMRAQIVADLKYLPVFKLAEDWWFWAAPGPGSQRGLNIVLERDIGSSWRPADWLEELTKLNDIVTPILEEIGIGRMHNQDLQNCLCEWSKYTKVARGIGRPRQIFYSGM